MRTTANINTNANAVKRTTKINEKIPSGIYNIADDSSISTNEIIKLMSIKLGKKHNIWNISKILIIYIAKIGDYLYLPLNTERLNKLPEDYVVSNAKIKKYINKPLPYSITQGLNKTLGSFI